MSAELTARLRRRIQAQGPLAFSEFMALALYDEAGGYYGRGRAPGPRGDFFTAGDLGPGLAQLLAAQAAEILPRLCGDGAARLIELGPGSGRLLKILIAELRRDHPELLDSVELVAVERSATLAAQQRETLGHDAARVRWLGLDALAREPAPAMVFGNELVDALPVDRFVRRGDWLFELRVGCAGGGGLVLVEVDAGEAPARALEAWPALPEPGCAFEICPAAGALLGELAAAVPAGLLLLIDYGDEAGRLFGPVRPHGTVRGYAGHELVDPLRAPGEQDITASVDFSALARQARDAGFTVLGRRPLVEASLALGAAEQIAALAGATDREALRARMSLLSLASPGGMGSRFQVFVAARGGDAVQPRVLATLPGRARQSSSRK